MLWTMETENYLLRLGGAGRSLCYLRGEDPDELIPTKNVLGGGPGAPDSVVLEPRWMRAARELQDLEFKTEVLRKLQTEGVIHE